MSTDLGLIILENFRYRLLADYPTQIRACLTELTDEEIWWRPNPQSNSIGNLLLHLSGNIRHYIGRGVGARSYERNRPAEFSETTPIPRTELLALFSDALKEAEAVLAELAPERLTEWTDRTENATSIYQLTLGVVTHLALHTGQIIYITKMLKSGVFADELWRRPRISEADRPIKPE